MKFRIKNSEGRYLQVTDEPGTLLFHTNPRLGTVFEGTQNEIYHVCLGMQWALGEEFLPESIIHFKPSTNEKVDDIHEGK